MNTTTFANAQQPSLLGSWIEPLQVKKRWFTSPPGLVALAQDFNPISLKQIDAVALLNRIDTKFVMTISQLLTALATLRQDYQMLVVNGQRLNHYRTLYFDAPHFDLYHQHVNGRADRYKVRSREYTDTSLSFLEVKHKTNKGRTIKERLFTEEPVVQMTLEAESWLEDVLPFQCQTLEPKMWNAFTRLTMVDKQHRERVTLDVDLAFYTADKTIRLDGIVIGELKMEADNLASPFMSQMRDQRIHPQGFSKYCIGVALLYDQVKKNAMKPKLLKLEKMTGEVIL